MKIPQCNPHASYLAQKNEIDEAIKRVLDSGWYILGKECELFEQEFADYIGVKHAVGVATGTDAIFLALKACGVKAGDEVITVSHTAVATVAAIVMSGAVPVFVDIDPFSYTMNATILTNVLTDKTRAIIPVHIYGMPADMPAIIEFAKENDLKVIEDCAQAHGAGISIKSEIRNQKSEDRIEWNKIGSFGDAATFSFYPTKNLGTFGDGGAVVTNNSQIADNLKKLRQYGWKERYISSSHGWNSRLDEMHAAILRVKLRELDNANDARRRIAEVYNDMLSECNMMTPKVTDDYKHVYHQYVVQLPDRDAAREQLAAQGIGTAIHYPLPVHLQSAYSGYIDGNLPDTEIMCTAILSLPIYPELSLDDAARVAEALRAVR